MVKSALLNKLRSSLERFFQRVALVVAKTGVSANQLTILSLIIALLGYTLILIYGSPVILLGTIMTTGFLDAIDGAVARLKGQASQRGAFLDSLVDRLCEMIYALAFLKLGLDVYAVLIYLGFSMIISYERARGESLGISMIGVGLMERGERLLGLMLVTTLFLFDPGVANIALIVLASLAAFTVVERAVYVWRNLELGRG